MSDGIRVARVDCFDEVAKVSAGVVVVDKCIGDPAVVYVRDLEVDDWIMSEKTDWHLSGCRDGASVFDIAGWNWAEILEALCGVFGERIEVVDS